MSYLQCPDCRLTVHAAAYYLRGERCPRCLTAMERCDRPQPRPGTPVRPQAAPAPSPPAAPA